MRPRSRSIEQYFQTLAGMRSWRQGRRIFEEALVNGTQAIPDGHHAARLVEGHFEPQKQNYPVSIFTFASEPGGKFAIEKRTPLHRPECVASLLLDLYRVGIKISKPEDLPWAYMEIERRTPLVELEVKTVMGIQTIGVFAAVPIAAKAPPVIVEETLTPEEEHAAPPPPPPPPPPTPEPPQPVEVEIQPGNKVVVDFKGQTLTGVVIKTFEDENEIVLQLPSGEKLIVPGDSIVAKVA